MLLNEFLKWNKKYWNAIGNYSAQITQGSRIKTKWQANRDSCHILSVSASKRLKQASVGHNIFPMKDFNKNVSKTVCLIVVSWIQFTSNYSIEVL